MNSWYIKSKKIFITFLALIVLSACISYVSAAYNTDDLKLGDKLKFTGDNLVVYKSRTNALLKNADNSSELKKDDEVTVKGILR